MVWYPVPALCLARTRYNCLKNARCSSHDCYCAPLPMLAARRVSRQLSNEKSLDEYNQRRRSGEQGTGGDRPPKMRAEPAQKRAKKQKFDPTGYPASRPMHKEARKPIVDLLGCEHRPAHDLCRSCRSCRSSIFRREMLCKSCVVQIPPR